MKPSTWRECFLFFLFFFWNNYCFQNLIEKFNNVLDVIKAVEFNITKQYLADVVFVTAHKSKGLDFDTVRIATDFPKSKNSLKYEEINLLYVAVTRAKRLLYLPDYIMEKIWFLSNK